MAKSTKSLNTTYYTYKYLIHYEFNVGNIYLLYHLKMLKQSLVVSSMTTNRCRKEFLTVISYFSVKIFHKKIPYT